MQCGSCRGKRGGWSDRSLVAWKAAGRTDDPPTQWMDRNCEECLGVGFVLFFTDGTKTPDWDAIVPSARARSRRCQTVKSPSK